MSTCLETIIKNESVLRLSTNIDYSFNVNSSLKKILSFETIQTETVLFSMMVSSQIAITSNLNLKITIFKLISGVHVMVGSINIIDINTNFQIDVTPGEYFLCVYSVYAEYNISIKAISAGFINIPRFSVYSFEGAFIPSLDPPKRIPKPCLEPLKFELIEGALPPGLVFHPNGIIDGVLPDLDCIEETKNNSPSFNWWTEVDNRVSIPLDKQWIFTVKVTMLTNTEVTAESKLCIRVYNNWSKDRDNFLAQTWDVSTYIQPKVNSIKLDDVCCIPELKLKEILVETDMNNCYCSIYFRNLIEESNNIPQYIKDILKELFYNKPFSQSEKIINETYIDIESIYYDTKNEIINIIKNGTNTHRQIIIDVKHQTYNENILSEIDVDYDIKFTRDDAINEILNGGFTNTSDEYVKRVNGDFASDATSDIYVSEVVDPSEFLEQQRLINNKIDFRCFVFVGETVEFDMPRNVPIDAPRNVPIDAPRYMPRDVSDRYCREREYKLDGDTLSSMWFTDGFEY